jgi:prolyl-tRNA synthetase
MKYSGLFPKTSKQSPTGAESINHKLLVRAGFIDQLMAGSWTLLPLGLRVVSKINDIIRDELNKTGAQELLMPLLHPKEIWNETGRWEDAKDIMYQFKKENKEFALSFTHEEIVVDLIRKHQVSPKDFPIKVYHFSTKFRHELRAKSGILRGREFLMKDLYSAHLTEEDMYRYYKEVIEAYKKIFKRIGFDVIVTEASGGVFTKSHSHEFQVLSPVGEDTIYHCECNECDFSQNEEIFKGKEGDKCEGCSCKIKKDKAIEIGNIFPLGTMYAEKMGAFYVDSTGAKKPLWLASYGIGPTRILGTLVEVFHDDKGIIWPESVAPYKAFLIVLHSEDENVLKLAENTYQALQKEGIEVLYDDRQTAAGEKFGDSDLLGLPVRLVISSKTGDKIEWKERKSEETELISFDEILKRLKKGQIV